jgi:hypothetical protein
LRPRAVSSSSSEKGSENRGERDGKTKGEEEEIDLWKEANSEGTAILGTSLKKVFRELTVSCADLQSAKRGMEIRPFLALFNAFHVDFASDILVAKRFSRESKRPESAVSKASFASERREARKTEPGALRQALPRAVTSFCNTRIEAGYSKAEGQ